MKRQLETNEVIRLLQISAVPVKTYSLAYPSLPFDLRMGGRSCKVPLISWFLNSVDIKTTMICIMG